jgi:hypothetical protein
MSDFDLDALEDRFLFEQRGELGAINVQNAIGNDRRRTEADVLDMNQAEF